MKFILGGINGEYLTDILLRAESEIEGKRRTEEVWAAVAYASGIDDIHSLLGWCFAKDIPLKFWGRLDEGVAVEIKILNEFLRRKSPNYICKLVQHHHAKVIWWRGYGVYIGSANLTYKAWNKNVEAGCFFEETELDARQADELLDMFSRIDENASPLTDELRDLMIDRAQKLKAQPDGGTFWQHPSVRSWDGLVVTTAKKAGQRHKEAFLTEWNETLQILRDLAKRVSEEGARPPWVDADASPGAQADQFLHAHYYHRTFEGRKAAYEQHFEQNRNRKEAALVEAIGWWRALPEAPSDWPGEDIVINSVSRELADYLSSERLPHLTKQDFRAIADRVYAIRDFARRARNSLVHLPEGTAYSIPEKLDALCDMVWAQKTANGRTILGVLQHILYDGPSDLLPERLWDAIADPAWKLQGVGISALGELVGWAIPERFPPRNGRTSKALRSLGHEVRVHVS